MTDFCNVSVPLDICTQTQLNSLANTVSLIVDDLCTAPLGSGAVDYSTSEHDTGIKWVDGKAIYRWVVDLSGYTGTDANVAITTGPTMASVDYLVTAIITYTNTDGNLVQGFPTVNTSNDATYYSVFIASSGTYGYLIFEYTKA